MTRRRYRFNEETNTLEEVPNDYTGADRRAQTATEELTYGGLQATDGTPINTRRRHREYMKTNSLALVGDFTNTWAKQGAEREAFRKGESREHFKAAKAAIVQAIHQPKRRR